MFNRSLVRRSCHTLVLGALLAATSACSTNPLTSDESDYGRRVSIARLRDIDTMDIKRYQAPPREKEPDIPEAIERLKTRFDNKDTLELSLEEARVLVLVNNLDLQVALINPEIANQRITEEEAAFESLFDLTARYNNIDSATTSTLASAQAEIGTIVPSVTVPLRTGGSMRFGLPVTRNRNDNTFTTLNPSWTTDLEFSLTHQLLRGAGRRSNSHGIRVAAYNVQISEAQTKLEIIRQIAATDRAFWRLYQARTELDVSQQLLEIAQEQLERAENRVDAGKVAEIEVIRAQSGVADQIEAILIRQNAVLRQQREVKRILNAPGLDLGDETMIVPTSLPDPVEYEFDPPALRDAAIANRMEMLELEIQLARDASQIDFNENQALPLFTMDYTYRVNGIGGTFEDSVSSVFDNDFADWELGLRAQVPIGNEAARSRVRSSIFTRLQRLRTKEARTLAITQEVYDAIDEIRVSWQRILAAQLSVVLNTRTLAGEQRQFDVGNRTSTDVLIAANQLAQAQIGEIRAIVDYQIAQTDLAFATGTLLGQTRVEWAPVNPSEQNSGGIYLDEAPPQLPDAD